MVVHSLSNNNEKDFQLTTISLMASLIVLFDYTNEITPMLSLHIITFQLI